MLYNEHKYTIIKSNIDSLIERHVFPTDHDSRQLRLLIPHTKTEVQRGMTVKSMLS